MRPLIPFFLFCCWLPPSIAQQKEFAIIAYYAGNDKAIDGYPVEKLTHIIYSFCHLKGNQLAVDNPADSLTIRRLVSLKAQNPKLKVYLSLGGWGGCKSCSEVFSTKKGRRQFSKSVKKLLKEYRADGIDLDWEYPAIEGHPGHPWKPADRPNFTKLVERLRKDIGWGHELSFAAGGFTKFLEESIEWGKVMPLLDYVNIMSYDLVHGYSTVTGHHTPLYSTKEQVQSTDRAVRFLDSIGVPMKKVIIGAAFYGRVWENVANINNGLYQAGKFKRGVSFSTMQQFMQEHPGFRQFWDDVAQAPYLYNMDKQLFLTHDNPLSVSLKTKYAKEKGLGGIMFWQLAEDVPTKAKLGRKEGEKTEGLLDAIYKAAHHAN
jgi:chitinase